MTVSHSGLDSSLHVTICGPDGAGKSTLVAALKSLFDGLGRDVAHIHFRPCDDSAGGAPIVNPHAQGARHLALALPVMIRRFWWYLVAERRGVLRKRSNFVVLQERGWLDQAVDPVRYRLTPMGARLAAAYSAGLRPPALHVLCAGDSLEIHRRKPELSVKEIELQLGKWRRLLRAKPSIEIDMVRVSPSEAASFVLARLEKELVEPPLPIRRVLGAPSRLEMVRRGAAGPAEAALYRPTTWSRRAAFAVGRRQPGLPVKVGQLPSPLYEVLREVGAGKTSLAAIRSVGRDRWVIAVTDGQRVTGITKVACAGDESLEREAKVLEALSEGLTGLVVPKVLGRFEGTGVNTLSLSVVSERFPRPSFDLEGALQVANILAHAFDGAGVLHGDFSPWNLLPGTPARLVDWEAGSLEFEPGRDLADYVVASALMRRGVSRRHARELLALQSPVWSRYEIAVGRREELAVVLQRALLRVR